MKPIVVPVVLALPLLALAPRQGANACVEVGGGSVWSGDGWTHLVYVTDRCDRDVACDVSTDVDPEEHHVSVARNETVLVVTATGSAARVFVPRVSCAAAP